MSKYDTLKDDGVFGTFAAFKEADQAGDPKADSITLPPPGYKGHILATHDECNKAFGDNDQQKMDQYVCYKPPQKDQMPGPS